MIFWNIGWTYFIQGPESFFGNRNDAVSHEDSTELFFSLTYPHGIQTMFLKLMENMMAGKGNMGCKEDGKNDRLWWDVEC